MEDSNIQGQSNFKEEENEEKKINYEISQPTKNIPVKTQIRNLEKDISQLRKDLNENKKLGNMLRGELLQIEGTIKDKCNELSKNIIDDLANFEKDLKRVIQNDRTENDFFKTQISSLNEDKIKISKEAIGLNSRLTSCERDIGVDS